MGSAKSTLMSRRHKVVDHLKFAVAGITFKLSFHFLLPSAVLNDDRATLDDFHGICLPIWT